MIKISVNKTDSEAFEKNFKDARAYHNRANEFLREGQPFSVIFNVGSVALERYLIALCNLYGVEPGNHNYGSIMDSVEIIVEFPQKLNEEIRSIDVMYDICSVDNPCSKVPDLSDSNKILLMCDEIQNLINKINNELIIK